MLKQYITAFIGGIIIVLGGLFLFLTPAGNYEPAPVVQAPTFTYDRASADTIVVTLPFPDAVVGKEFSVLGRARGWYFEASFPVELLDKDGNVLAQAPAQAQGDWMTSEFVDFKADLVVANQNYIGPATLVLKKDNPSGEPQNDASVSLPITVEY
jgi:hypothetical protein